MEVSKVEKWFCVWENAIKMKSEVTMLAANSLAIQWYDTQHLLDIFNICSKIALSRMILNDENFRDTLLMLLKIGDSEKCFARSTWKYFLENATLTLIKNFDAIAKTEERESRFGPARKFRTREWKIDAYGWN